MTDLTRLLTLAEKATKGPWAAADWMEKDGSALTAVEARVPCVDDFQRQLWGGDTKPAKKKATKA